MREEGEGGGGEDSKGAEEAEDKKEGYRMGKKGRRAGEEKGAEGAGLERWGEGGRMEGWDSSSV